MDTLFNFNHLSMVLADYAKDLEYYYKENLSKDDRVASGNLLSSVTTYVQNDGTDFEVYLNVADYWRYVEEGRKAGKYPPIDNILEWIRVKPILPDARTGQLPTEKQLAFLIARKIATEGTEGTHTLQTTLDDLNALYEAKISDAIMEDLSDAGDRILFLLRD